MKNLEFEIFVKIVSLETNIIYHISEFTENNIINKMREITKYQLETQMLFRVGEIVSVQLNNFVVLNK